MKKRKISPAIFIIGIFVVNRVLMPAHVHAETKDILYAVKLMEWIYSIRSIEYSYSIHQKQVGSATDDTTGSGADRIDIQNWRFISEEVNAASDNADIYRLRSWDGSLAYIIEAVTRHKDFAEPRNALIRATRPKVSIEKSISGSGTLWMSMLGAGNSLPHNLVKKNNKDFDIVHLDNDSEIVIATKDGLHVAFGKSQHLPKKIYTLASHKEGQRITDVEYTLDDWVGVNNTMVPCRVTLRRLQKEYKNGYLFIAQPIEYEYVEYRISPNSIKINTSCGSDAYSPVIPAGSVVHNHITGARYTVENEGPLVESEARIQQRLEELIEEAKSDEGAGK